MATTRRRTLLFTAAIVLAGAPSSFAFDLAGSETAGISPSGPVAFDVEASLLPLDRTDTEKDGAGWASLLALHSLSVVADMVTTQRAFEHGAVEANPLYSWAGPDGALGLRAATGFALSLSVHRTNTKHPRLARGILWSTIALNFAVAAHNERLADAQP